MRIICLKYPESPEKKFDAKSANDEIEIEATKRTGGLKVPIRVGGVGGGMRGSGGSNGIHWNFSKCILLILVISTSFLN